MLKSKLKACLVLHSWNTSAGGGSGHSPPSGWCWSLTSTAVEWNQIDQYEPASYLCGLLGSAYDTLEVKHTAECSSRSASRCWHLMKKQLMWHLTQLMTSQLSLASVYLHIFGFLRNDCIFCFLSQVRHGSVQSARVPRGQLVCYWIYSACFFTRHLHTFTLTPHDRVLFVIITAYHCFINYQFRSHVRKLLMCRRDVLSASELRATASITIIRGNSTGWHQHLMLQ